MAFETREGSGALFKNSKRDKDSQPNARGECRIDGVLYEVSAWTKKDKNGNPWQSLAFKRKQDTPPASGARRPRDSDSGEEIPF